MIVAGVLSLAAASAVALLVSSHAPGGSHALPPTPTPTPTFNVMGYGAKADGVTDDSTALLKAMNAAVAAGGVVYCPAGTYKIAGQLTIPNSVTVYGDGMTTSWLKGHIVFGSHQTFSDLKMGDTGEYGVVNGLTASYTTFQDCYFVGGLASDNDAAGHPPFGINEIMFGSSHGPVTHITLEGCRIGGGPKNACDMLILDHNGCVSDITIDNCYFETGQFMGFACGTRPDDATATGVYQRVNLTNCTFAPQASEAISYDGPSFNANCTISNTLIEGYGTDPNTYDQGFEINGVPGFTVSGVTIWSGGDRAWNLSGPTVSGVPVPCNWSFTNCVADMTEGTVTNDGSQPLMATGMNGATWTNCSFAPLPPHGDAWLQNCTNNTFTGCTWNGADTWWNAGGCSGNTGLPTREAGP